MGWLSRKTGIVISAELGRTIERTCSPVMEDPGEIVGIRTAGSGRTEKTLTGSRRVRGLPSPKRLDADGSVKFASGF